MIMREILFRAYQKNFKRMLPVVGIEYDANGAQAVTVDNRGMDGKYDVIPYYSRYIDGDEEFPLDTLVLMQSTGLRDKNGTKIFEGDIIEEGYNNMADRWVTKKWIVKWSQIRMAWMVYSDERNPYSTRANVICTNKNVIKVIGNIYDNKEYLK